MSGHDYGHTETGKPITDELVEELAAEAERGYEPGRFQGRRRGPGRPPLGAAAKSVESVRLEPALRADVAQRAADEGVTVSEVIRRALREYLDTAWHLRSIPWPSQMGTPYRDRPQPARRRPRREP